MRRVPHIHTLEDEILCVVSGEIGFCSNGKEVTLAAGGYIVKPRNELHSMWNAGSARARMIELALHCLSCSNRRTRIRHRAGATQQPCHRRGPFS